MIKNYYQQFLDEVDNIDFANKPKLLLHVCCAPCSSHCISVVEKYFDITVYFYNPNISPFEEYQKRFDEEKKFLSLAYPNIKLIDAEYDSQNFENMARGLENLKEGGDRCKKCYKMRLEKTAQFARENNFDFFTTTLTLSPYKNSDVLNEIGGEVAEKFGVKYLFSDFKKDNGYQHSIELSHRYNLYRQNYCGCRFSKMAREEYEKQKLEKKKDI